MSKPSLLTATNNITFNKDNKSNPHITDKRVYDIYNLCYNTYKSEYNNNLDFSMASEDITEEIDEIITDFDKKLNRRNNILSTSIYCDILDEFEIELYPENKSKPERIATASPDVEPKQRLSRRFSDIQKFSRNLEIKTEDEEEEVKKVEKEDRVKDSVLITEEYNLSISNILDKSVFRGSEILLSQPNILTSSQLSKNFYNVSNPMSKGECEDVGFSKMGSFNIEDKYTIEKRKSVNESIDMTFFNQLDASQFGKFLPLDLPDLGTVHNTVKTDKVFQGGSLNPSVDIQKSSDNVPSDLSDYSPKFLSDLNVSNSIIADENLTRHSYIDKYFEKIHNQKTINIKTYSFKAKIRYEDLKTNDLFLENFLKLFEKEKFLNQNYFIKLKDNYKNRFEVYFLDICRMFLNLKKEIFCQSDGKTIFKLKKEIMKAIDDCLFLINNKIILLHSEENYLFKPALLLKLWDNVSEDSEVSSYDDLLKLFFIKVTLKNDKNVNSLIKAFNEVKVAINEPKVFDRSQIFIYYLGKISALVIGRINEIHNSEVTKYFTDNNLNNFTKVILKYGLPNCYNYKKTAKNYEHLVKIAIHFGENPIKIDQYRKKAKKYFEFYNDPNKLTLTKESAVSDDGATSQEEFY